MAPTVHYSEPKDMLKSYKLGNGKQKAALAALLLLLGVLSPAKLHAEDRRAATSQLHIQISIVPTLAAAQQASQTKQQPSQSPVSFNFEQSTTQKNNSETQVVTVQDQNGSKQVAVLETLTTVTE